MNLDQLLTMIWIVITFLGTGIIKLTFGEPHVSLPKLFETNAIRRLGQGSEPACQTTNECELSIFQKGKKFGENSEDTNDDLNSNLHLASFLANRKEYRPYSWETNLFDYKNDFSCDYHLHVDRNIHEISISEKMKKMKQDHSLLRKRIKSFHGVLSNITSTENQNAYEFLDMKLRQLRAFNFTLFNTNKQRLLSKYHPIHKLNVDMKWKVFKHYSQTTISELESFYLNAEILHTFIMKKCHQILQSQVLGILNFFMKYQLIDEDFYYKWIHKKRVYELIIEHFVDLSNPPTLYDIGLKQSLLKNGPPEHFSIILKLLNQEDWMYVDYECFKKKKECFFQPSYRNIEQRMVGLEERFSSALFERCSSCKSKEREAVVTDLIRYFNSSPCELTSVNAYSTYGLLYGMLWFIIKYYPDLFTSSFESKPTAILFSFKLVVLDALIKWLRSAYEVEFMAWNGFWTTEVDARDSPYLISLEQLFSMNSIKKQDSTHFTNQCGSYNSTYFNHYMISKGWSIRSKKNGLNDINWVNVNNRYTNNSECFGTNFRLVGIEEDKSKDIMGKDPHLKKMISTKFLSEAYGWIDELERLLSKFSSNQNSYVEIIRKIVVSQEEKWIEDDLKIWIKESPIVHVIYKEIEKHLVASQAVWDRFQTKLELLNQHISHSAQYSTDPVSENQTSKKPRFSQDKEEITKYPENSFSGHTLKGKSKKIGRNCFMSIPKLQFVNKKPLIEHLNF